MKHCLLDSSFIIDLLNEMAGGKAGAALGWLRRFGELFGIVREWKAKDHIFPAKSLR